MFFSLQKLNLSFNKISSLFNLKQLYGPQYSNFTHFDIRGNNISQLLEIKNLAGCTFLIDLAFQGQTGANPVCKDPEYIYSVIKSAPSLKFLDHQPVSNYSKTIFQEIPKIHSEKQKPEENNENQEIIAIETKKQKENNENLILNKKLQQEFDELNDAYKELSYKYKHSEDYWITCVKKLEDSNSHNTNEIKDIENENRRLRRKLNSKIAKINNLKSKTAVAINNTGTKDKALEDLHFQISNLMRDLGESQRMSQQALDDVYKKQEKIKNLEKSNFELKNEVKKMEGLTTQLHSKALESSTNALYKYEELQKKHEEALALIEEKEYEISVIKKKT